MARVASPRRARAAPEVMGETAVMPARRDMAASTAGQLAMVRRRWARAWVSLAWRSPGATGQAGATRSSGGEITMCACAPSVLLSVLVCKPVTSAEM